MRPTLFYESELAHQKVAQLVSGVIVADPVDTLDFPDEQGGVVSRELGVPFLNGMDDFVVTDASLRLRAKPKPMDILFKKTNAEEGGVVVSLAKPRRVRSFQIQFPDPGKVPPLHLVVRTVTGAPGSFQFGPPIFASADPPLKSLGKMFGPVLAGMSVADVEGGGKTLSFPPQLGSAWLIQLATGDEATKLDPMPVHPDVKRVVADSLPENLTVVLAADDGPVTLWSHPNLLLPESNYQQVSFLPLAQKYLAKRLKIGGKATLTVPLNFHSDSGCQVEVIGQSLQGEYRVRPFGPDPLKLRVGGGWDSVKLNAPSGLRPLRATVDITAKPLGRVLNGASPEPPLDAPVAGMRVNQGRQVAAARGFAPLPPAKAGSVLPLVSVRVLASAVQDTETVLELRGDVTGLPGPLLAPPVPAQIQAGPAGWIEFVLPRPLPVSTGRAPLWVALRVTRGELLWFAGAPAGGGVRFSDDKAKTWDLPDAVLTPVSDLWVQLFHQQADPQPAPTLRVRFRDITLSNDLIQGASRLGPREFRAVSTGLPVSGQLAAGAEQGRTDTVLRVFSPAVADITFTNAALAYDPFSGGNA